MSGRKVTAVGFLTAEEVALLPRPDLSVAAPENRDPEYKEDKTDE